MNLKHQGSQAETPGLKLLLLLVVVSLKRSDGNININAQLEVATVL
jgi:hypothetical protein